jgi:hypothetical protein
VTAWPHASLVRLIGRRVRVLLHASDLVIYDGRTEAARDERLPGGAGARLDLDHYLEALVSQRDQAARSAGPAPRERHRLGNPQET